MVHDSRPTTAPDAKQRGLPSRYSCLDALRGAAALAVVCYHLWKRFFPGLSTQGGPQDLDLSASVAFLVTFPTLQYGYIGVNLFFVLSGFCIHLPFARGDASFDAKRFYARRFWRLYPAYAASLALAAGAVGIFPILGALRHGRSVLLRQSLCVDDVVQNAFFLQWLSPESLRFNGVYWTILYEVQFYALYPLLLLLLKRCRIETLLAVSVCVEAYLAYYPLHATNLFIDRYYEWLLGAYAAEMFTAGRRLGAFHGAMAFFVFVAAGACCTLISALWPLHDIFFSTGFFYLVTTAMSLPRLSICSAGRHIAERAVGFGTISYSLYLVHIPVMDVVWRSCDHLSGPGTQIFWRACTLISIPGSIFVARYFYHVFEAPFMKGTPLRMSLQTDVA